MKTPLAWHNLLHNKVRTTVAVVGVAFPLVLVFMQLGLYEAFLAGTTRLYEALDFDLVLLSTEYVALGETRGFPRSRLAQTRAARGVQEVIPLYVGFYSWRNPDTRVLRKLFVIGSDPRRRVFRLPEVTARLEALHLPRTVLIDRLTLPVFGPQHTGVVTEVNGHRITIRGQYTLGLGFTADGGIIVSDTTFAQLAGSSLGDEVHLGLVQLAPGAVVHAVGQELRRHLPHDVEVLSRAEFEALEKRYWVQSTSVGIILGSGVLVGLLIEMIILYQILSTDVINRLPEYATLKAMGYSHGALAWIVVQYAVLLGSGGYLSGFGVACALYKAIAEAIHLPVSMDFVRGVGVGMVTLMLCMGASLLALRKVRLTDPAELFQ
jgi:putative ABC transport system permease protein